METDFPSLAKLLSYNSKLDLIRIAKCLNIKISQKNKKAVFINQIADFILNNPIQFLRRLPHHEVLRLQKMVHDENNMIPWDTDIFTLFDCITDIGITDINITEISENDFNLYECIYSDLGDTLRPVIDDYIAAYNPNKEIVRHERIILGMLNLYGILLIEKLYKLITALDPTIDSFSILTAFNESYLLSYCIYNDENIQGYVHSPFMEDPYFIQKKIVTRPFEEKPKFTLEEVLAAGELPVPHPPVNSKSAKAMRLIKPLFNSEQDMQIWVANYWMNNNNDHECMDDIIELLQDNCSSPSDMEKILNALIKWSNRLPQWILQGDSANEIFERIT